MSFANIDVLTNDQAFVARTRSCCTQQSETFVNDARPEFVWLAQDIQRGGPVSIPTFVRLIAAFPGIVEQATRPDGSVDQTLITDEDILAQVQAGWPNVAALWYVAPASS